MDLRGGMLKHTIGHVLRAQAMEATTTYILVVTSRLKRFYDFNATTEAPILATSVEKKRQPHNRNFLFIPSTRESDLVDGKHEI
jgi:hypothetical protein